MNRRMKTGILLLTFLTLCWQSCTRLDTRVYDRVENFWQTDEQIAAGLAPAYTGLRKMVPLNGTFDVGLYTLLELTADGLLIPKRGLDWVDGGIWEELWKHKWTSFSPTVQFGWTFIYGGITRINMILQTLESLSPRPNGYASIVAELKTVRALYNFWALDLFGNVPIADKNDVRLSDLKQSSRTFVFAFIEKELKENIPLLNTEVSQATYGRATRWFAFSILAKLYLNSVVYTGANRWTDCIAACDSILSSGKYELEPDYFANFRVQNENSRENIFAIPFDSKAGLGDFWMQQATLHPNSRETFGLKTGGYNGLCSIQAYYQLFSAIDIRRRIFLVGQQYKDQVTDPNNLQYDNGGHLLFFDPAIPTFSLQPPFIETGGARCAKWEFDKETITGTASNDFAVFRLADIILMKAEAQFRSQDLNGALSTINQPVNGITIRSRAGLPPVSAGEMNAEGLLKERANELSWEGWRRNDLIRFGHFSDARTPEKDVSPPFRSLFPIPKAELDRNPYLVQNPGY